MAFAKAGSGGMIKRLHLGRAAEGGVIAARLAQRGYEGPPSVLEGRFGVLEAFCEDTDPSLLTKGLGRVYEIERLCIKRYACHVTAQVPVQLLRGWIEQHGFARRRYRARSRSTASAKVVSHHSDADPGRYHAGAIQRAVRDGAERLPRPARSGRVHASAPLRIRACAISPSACA